MCAASMLAHDVDEICKTQRNWTKFAANVLVKQVCVPDYFYDLKNHSDETGLCA